MSLTLSIKNATLSYVNTNVFENISLTLPGGKWVALLGASGVGKSSLLRLIAGLLSPEETWQAEIEVDSELQLDKQIAYMAQQDLLLPWLTALQNVMLGAKLRAAESNDHTQFKSQAVTLLTQVGLEKTLHYYPHQLSGGMRQRVALARTLLENKPIVLMDEPFSALDAITRHKLQALAAQLLKDKTVLFVTHDPFEAVRLAHHIYMMQSQAPFIKLVSTLSSAIPRDMTDSEFSSLPAKLFSELNIAAGEA